MPWTWDSTACPSPLDVGTRRSMCQERHQSGTSLGWLTVTTRGEGFDYASNNWMALRALPPIEWSQLVQLRLVIGPSARQITKLGGSMVCVQSLKENEAGVRAPRSLVHRPPHEWQPVGLIEELHTVVSMCILANTGYHQ